jgi:serine/threonine protein kinase/tetratricopeptide (TPR) repeat protein
VQPPDNATRGSTLGRYVLLDRVGEGGMGIVHAAWDPQLDRKVAIKLLGREASHDSSRHQRLRREAQTMARLRHPNVATVFDLGEIAGRVYIAMEFVDGPNLREWLAAKPRPATEILTHFIAAGRGLLAAHQAGIVHRDFKPDNVVVTHEGRVLVLDFGLARWLGPGRSPSEPDGDAGDDSSSDVGPSDIHSSDIRSSQGELSRSAILTHVEAVEAVEAVEPVEPAESSLGLLVSSDYLTVPGTVLGTPAFMAPEQRSGRPADDRSDQYAFCVALWLGLSGRHPFGTGTRGLVRARTGKLREFSRRDLPRSVVRAIERGLAWEPERRWPDMSKLLDALERRPQRSWLGWLAGAGVVAALGLGFGLASSRAEPEAPTCPDSRTRVATIWNEAAADELAHRWTRSGPGRPSTRAWLQVQTRIDAWVEIWEVAHAEVCQAHVIRHESSDALHDRQMACLDRQLGSLADLLELLGGLTHAEQLVGIDATLALPRVEDCLDRDRLLDAPEYADPQQRDELERQLARIELLVALGRWGQVREQATKMIEAIGSEPEHSDLVVLAKLHMAGALEEADEAEAAEQAALEATRLAVTLTEPELRGFAFVVLADVLITRNSLAEAEHWLSLAHAIGTSVDTPELAREAAIVESRLAAMIGQYDRALEANQRAFDRTDPEAQPLAHAVLIRQFALLHLQIGDTEAALREYAEVSSLLERETGGTHPELPQILYDTAVTYEDLGRLSEAETMFERAAARSAEVAGERAPYTIIARARQAKVHGMLGECERAQRELDELMPDAREQLLEPMSRLLHFLSWRAGLCGYSTREALPLSEEILALTFEAVGPEHVATFFARIGIGVALVQRGELVRARAALEQGLAGVPDPTVDPKLRPRDRWRWALGATALGIVELREGQLEAGRERIERASTDLRDAELRELAEHELATAELATSE